VVAVLNIMTLFGDWIDAKSEQPPRAEDYGSFWRSKPVLITDGKEQWVGYWQSWENEEYPSSWRLLGPDGLEMTDVTHWMPLPLLPNGMDNNQELS